jgi:NADH:ubiquinone oxidoreductase subunit 5 (subunit L)/multisubunit Na+/H+ antiporter MnhA subunit
VPVLILLLPVGGFALLRLLDASLPVTIGGLQAAVLAAYGLLTGALPRSRVTVSVERLLAAVSMGAWRTLDVTVIDGIVDGVGLVVRGWSGMLRRAQSGSVRVYALSMLTGVVAMLGYFLWR